MPELHAALAERVAEWRAGGYRDDDHPAISEILPYAIEGEVEGAPFPESGGLRYLRAAQLRALETYWYLRIVERTPHVTELYKRLFEQTAGRLAALGLD